MSGIEVAGIVLAVLPLIIAAVQNYSDCVEEYSHYRSSLNRFRVRLSIDQTLFQDTLERLILPELSDDERTLYFSAVGGDVATAGFWSSVELDRKFRSRLGSRYETFMEAVIEMRQVLEKLMDKLDIDAQGKPKWGKLPANPAGPPSQGSSRLQWEWRKIHRSLGSKKRDKLLTRFEEYNAILGRWVENKEVLTVDKSSADKDLQRKSFLDYLELVRNHACRLHSILKNGWLCNCIVPHGANLELDQRVDHQRLVRKLPSFQVSFSFFSMPDQTQEIHKQWKYTEIEVDEMDQATLAQFAGQGTPPVNFSRPRVRFEGDLTNHAPSPRAIPVLPPASTPKKCLCQAIRSTPTGSQQICSLPDTSSNKIARIKVSSRSPSPANATGQPIYLDLGDLLPSQSLVASLPAVGTLSRRQRVGLAVSLASAVLQLYESPWMDELWDKRDIQFMFNGLDTERHPTLSNPYVSRHFQPLQVASNIATRDSALTNSILNRSVINKPLFALGIVLIELCLNKPFEDLRTTTSGISLDESPNILDDYDIANKAISDVYQEGGDDYGYVVQRCLRCEFQGQDSLKKLDVPKFRSLVYEGVLEPLLNDYKKYSLYL